YHLGVAWPSYFARRYDEAIPQYRKVIESDPAFPAAYWSLGESLEAQGRYTEAIEAFRKSADLSARSVRALAGLGHALGAAGRRDEAAGILKELDQVSRSRYVSPMFRAMIYTGLGDKDQAFAWLDAAVRERSDWMMQVPVWPLFDPLRSDSRYSA